MKAVLAFALLPSIAMADPFCAALDRLVESADREGVPGFELAEVGAASECSRSLELGGIKAVTCGWAFEYRADAATEAFDLVLQSMRNCGTALGRDEAEVSHPDSYDLRMYDVGGARVSISLKDKGALEQPWLFLRVGSR